jgi:hypothetical protein
MAVSSGAEELEAAALVTREESVGETDLEAVRDLGGKARVFVAGLDGVLRATLSP